MSATSEAKLETNRGRITASDIVDDLTYRCYAHNRTIFPHVTPEEWVPVFGERTAAMEERFQAERDGLAGDKAATPNSPSPSQPYNPDALVGYYEERGGCYEE